MKQNPLESLSLVQKVLALCAIVLICVTGYVLSRNRQTTPQSVETIAAESIPPLTPEIEKMLEESDGFEALVSYTNTGFEPTVLTFKSGDTVRFTNNSSRELWVAAGDVKYPKTKGGCGSSDLDSCRPLQPQEFWEFTVDRAGSWEVLNNLDKTHIMVIDAE